MPQICTFRVEDRLLGLEVMQVQEVLRYQEMTPIFLAPPAVCGLINLRGQIVTAIDLRVCLGLAPRTDGSKPMNVILRTDQGLLSLLVDQIGDVLQVAEGDLAPPPDNLTGEGRELVGAVCPLQETLLLLLDLEKLEARAFSQGEPAAAAE